MANCAYCNGVLLQNEDRWTVDGQPLHITLRPGADGTDPKDTCYWAFKHDARAKNIIWPSTVFQLRWRH